MKPLIWVYGEHRDGRIRSVVLELISAAKELAEALDGEVEVVALGSEAQLKRLEDLLWFGTNLYYLCHEELSYFRDDTFSSVLAEEVKERAPYVFLFGSTSEGQALAARIAGILKLGLTSHCVALKVDEEKRLVQIRPSFGEDIMAEIVSLSTPQMATIKPKSYPEAKPEATKKGHLKVKKLEEVPKSRIKRVGRKSLEKADPFSQTKVVVAGGRGLGSKETFEKLFELAEVLSAAVGSTRPPCDMGWISEDHMIGVSGHTVTPKLYLAFGISGALQHLVGVKAESILAVNTDPEAPIMKRADLSVVTDARALLPLLVRRLKADVRKTD